VSAGNRARGFGPAYPALLALSALLAAAAVATLLPYAGASWPCVLGYKALCTFAPASTFACALLAAIACTIRARLVRRMPGPAFVPVAGILLLAGLFAWSTAAWAREDAKYADGSSSASVQVGSRPPVSSAAE
jgi:hypothetical protein